MAAANPERTSWSPEEPSRNLEPVWFKPFEPYISQKTQIIAAYGNLYVATARGLYALAADSGAEQWVYPTALPLGHSPTIDNGVAYVGGFDQKLHAVDATTGEGLWTFTAGAGFETNPLVVGGIVYAGNRDGRFYAIHAEGQAAGELAWSFQTGGPILYSAAYKDGVVFFASNDSHAYALQADTGALVWQSEKLAGGGFYSWWPVVYEDRVIFTASENHRVSTPPGAGSQLNQLELQELYPGYDVPPYNQLIGALSAAPGDWAPGTPTIDASVIMNYFASKPWRRTVFVLDRFTGADVATAPVLYTGTHSGTRYPPVVGADGVLYQQNNYISDPAIPGGQIAGWQPGVPYISVVSSDWGAVDEPHAASAGGSHIYWNLCCDRTMGAFDVTIPNTVFAERWAAGIRPPTGGMDPTRESLYFGYDLAEIIPGYDELYFNPGGGQGAGYAVFASQNGIYGHHGDTNAPVPYNGRLYTHRSNAIIAFGETNNDPVELPMAANPAVPGSTAPIRGEVYLRGLLADQVEKILDAGHLRPGYMSHGIFDFRSRTQDCGDYLSDYWHLPAETLYTLIIALPHLPVTLQQPVMDYLQAEYEAFPPHEINHIGWADGAAREIFDLPAEAEADLSNYPPDPRNTEYDLWGLNPFTFYATWKYAQLFGGASAIYNVSKNDLEFPPPSNALLLDNPHAHNAYIAGYLGFLELESLAGAPESVNVRTELNRLMALRAAEFTADSAYSSSNSYCRTLNIANNFMYLTPELAQYLAENVHSEVYQAILEYEAIAPYWFVSFATEGFAENAINPLYDSHAMFMAKALIIGVPQDRLEAYLDVPGFARGDLFYIQKLVAALNQVYDNQVYLPLSARLN
ncbi:MAG: PQQ-binding-like beta-propeller repeat protein [Candidatus Promineifilaceae bacterium]